MDTDRWLPHVDPTPGDSLPTIAVSPYMSNPRMIAQRGAFLVTGDSFTHLEEQFNGNLRTDGYIQKIVLPAETYTDCQRFVELTGGSHFGYFPDFQGLREEFEELDKHEIEACRALSARP